MALILLGVAFAAEDGIGVCTDMGVMFENITAEAGVRANGNSLGVTMNDIDGDGDIDMYVASAPSRSEHAVYYPGESLLFLNNGDMTFEEVGADWGVDDLCEDRAPMFGDLDNDGVPDMYVTVNGRNLLYKNRDFATFEDVTAQGGDAGHMGWGHQGFLFDYDLDGFLDVFYTNGPEDGSGNNTLLRNQGDGTFRETTDHAGVGGDPSGKGSCVLDVDVDGWPDIFVTTGREFSNHLYMNQRDGTFRDEAVSRGISDPLQRFGVGTACSDIDNDGDPDIVLVTHDKDWTGNQLFVNNGGVFNDVAGSSGIVDFVDGHGLAVFDFDLDGFDDMIMSGIRTTPYVWHGNGDTTFERLCDAAGLLITEGLTWAVSWADLNDDAYPEVYVTHGLGRRPRDNELFLNTNSGNHWLKVALEGVTHNPSQIGARVAVVRPDGETITRWVGNWSSFDSQGELALTFGLGEHEVATSVVATFTNGERVELTDVAADQLVTIVEPSSWADDDSDGVPDAWDICPQTRLGHRTDGQGCALGQQGGVGVGLVSPEQDAVLLDPPTFTWDATGVESAVVQVSLDGTFGAAGRVSYGPVEGNSLTLTDDQFAELQDLTDGMTPWLWRVVAVGEDGEAQTEPRRFHVSLETDFVETPEGANVYVPAHIHVPVGSAVTWWNNTVAAGNIQDEPHDVQLVSPSGVVFDRMKDLNGGAFYTYTFDEPGTWYYVCQRHSGLGVNSDQTMETTMHLRADGPFRCMAGTVTVR